MAHKRNAIKERIKEFHSECADSDNKEVLSTVKKALKDRHCMLAKQAAEVCEERLLYDLEVDLIKAFQRFLKNPIKSDPNCLAKGAIARTLVALDCQDIDFFIAGIQYCQLEPTWGGSEDTAIDVRVSCAIGLANTSHPRALMEVLPLLYDDNPHVRRGAVRAISVTQPMAAEAVLRTKALSGDSEPEVIAEALSALLKVAPDESRGFVSSFLEPHIDPTLRESIALAIGASKVDAALDILRSSWDNQPIILEKDFFLLLGAILHRSDNAFAWLLEMVAKGGRASAQYVITELAIYSTDRRLRERLKAALVERDDDALTKFFNKIWH
jgi:HEAT repeat protein